MKMQISTLEQLKELKEGGVREGKSYDYKAQHYGNTDKDKKEFLADITSFANTIGGALLIGVEEKEGLINKYEGITIEDKDKYKLRIDNIIRDGVSPRIRYDLVLIENRGKTIVVVNIPKSNYSPHRVVYKSHDKFYARNSAGKYPLDVEELRGSFLRSSSLTERIREFVRDRLANIEVGNTPISMRHKSSIVMHIIPLLEFDNNHFIEISASEHQKYQLQPLIASSWDTRINLDGFVSFAGTIDDTSTTYTQIYRNGIIEAVDTSMLSNNFIPKDYKYIPSIAYEKTIIEGYHRYIDFLKNYNIKPPVIIYLSLLNVKGFYMSNDDFRISISDPSPIDRESILLPEIEIFEITKGAHEVFKPLFDMIWNACGYGSSLNYDHEGNWKPSR